MSGCGGWPRASARGTTRQYYFIFTPNALSLALSRGLELFFWIRITFSSAAPSLVQASSFCKKLPASCVFTATFLKFIQLLHVLIGQSLQPSDRDVLRHGEDCDIRNGGSCGVRDGDARSGVRDCSSFMGSSIVILQGLVRFIRVYSYPLKIIQLLHVLIGQSFQSSAWDVWDGGDCIFGTAVLAVVVRSAEPVLFGTAVLVVVFALAKFMVFSCQVQLLHWF